MKLNIREMAVFGMLGALMYASKILMDLLPNIHLLAMFTITLTVVYRKKALYPIYIFVLILGFFSGFATWWIPHLYLWTVLWGVVMLLPSPDRLGKWAVPVYMVTGALHGALYGVLYAPAQALLFGLSFQNMLIWIATGFIFDLVHGVSNFFCCSLCLPLIRLLQRLESMAHVK